MEKLLRDAFLHIQNLFTPALTHSVSHPERIFHGKELIEKANKALCTLNMLVYKACENKRKFKVTSDEFYDIEIDSYGIRDALKYIIYYHLLKQDGVVAINDSCMVLKYDRNKNYTLDDCSVYTFVITDITGLGGIERTYIRYIMRCSSSVLNVMQHIVLHGLGKYIKPRTKVGKADKRDLLELLIHGELFYTYDGPVHDKVEIRY